MILLVDRLGRGLDWSADHAGDVYYFVAMALAVAAAVVLVIAAAVGAV